MKLVMEPGYIGLWAVLVSLGLMRVKSTEANGWESFLSRRRAWAVMTKEDLCWLCGTHVLMCMAGRQKQMGQSEW